MAVWRDGVSLTVEIAFATAPQATPTWVDVTDYVRDVPNVFRGRTDEYASFSPGSATVVLDNRDRRFDPDYAAGAYYPNVLPGKRIKITWAFAAASGVLFTGYVQGWPQYETPPSDAWVVLQCVDGTRLLEQATLPGSAFESVVSTIVDPVFNMTVMRYFRGPLPIEDYGREPISGVGQYTTTGPSGELLFPETVRTSPVGLPGVADLFSGWHHRELAGDAGQAAGARTLSFVAQLNTTSDYVNVESSGNIDLDVTIYDTIFWFSIDDGSAIDEFRIWPHAASLGVAHLWTFTVISGVLYVFMDDQNIITHTLAFGGGSLENVSRFSVVTFGDATANHFAVWSAPLSVAQCRELWMAASTGLPGELGGARIDRALDDAGWPSGLRDLDTGGTPQAAYLPASQTAMSYLRDVELSEHGMVFLDASGDVRFIDRQTIWKAANTATLSDDGAAGAIKYVDAVRGSSIDTIRNIVDVTYVDGSVTRKDATSVTAYGEVRESIACPTMPTDELAASLAGYVVREKVTPGMVVSSLVAPLRVSGGDNEAETLLALEIGDRVTWERTPVGVSPQVVKTLIVQGLSHSISRDQWLVSLYLSPMPTSYIDAPYLTVADSTYGKIGATAGNLIPF